MHFSTTFGAVRHFVSLFKLLQINRGLTDISLRVAFRVFHPFPWKTYNIFLQTRSKTISGRSLQIPRRMHSFIYSVLSNLFCRLPLSLKQIPYRFLVHGLNSFWNKTSRKVYNTVIRFVPFTNNWTIRNLTLNGESKYV